MHRFHGRDLRKGRFSEPDRPYLVTTVTRHRNRLFSDFTTARLVVAEMRLAEQAGFVESMAWVLMPDHLHWLMSPQSETLSEVMSRVKSRSTRAINQRMGTTASCWEKGFHDRALRRNQDIRAVARYIIANPLRAGMVEYIGEYPLWDAVWL